MSERVNETFCQRWTFVSFTISVLQLLVIVEQSEADYVETAPRPGAPLPPPISPGECPLVFLQADLQYAKQTLCSSGNAVVGLLGTAVTTASPSSTTCCDQLKAVLWKARVRYANETGRLLLPQASAETCIQNLNSSAAAAGLPAVGKCEITHDALSEDMGRACGDDLATVYGFWSASNRTFPGMVGSSCFGANVDCGLCTALIANKTLSLSSSTTSLLATASCQDLARVAMTAAAYPIDIANGIARCLYTVDIAPISPAPECTDYDWWRQNWTSMYYSCAGGLGIYQADCCYSIEGQYQTMLAVSLNWTYPPLTQGQVDECLAKQDAAVLAQSVYPLEPFEGTCNLTVASMVFSIGCYNYTTLQQQIPIRYFEYSPGKCRRASPNNCRRCTQALSDVRTELAITTNYEYLNACQQLRVHQYYQWVAVEEFVELAPELAAICYPQSLPEILPLGNSPSNIVLIAGLSTAVVLLVVLGGAAFFLRRRYPLYKAKWNAERKTLGRLSSLRQRFVGSGLQVFTKKQLSKATQDFNESRLVGVGGSGKVYVGELNGEVVAVKDATFGSNRNGAKEAWNEVATLAQYRHRHLVVLKGCCISGTHSFLVYEFLEQGSVDDHLCPVSVVTLGRPNEHSVRAHFLDWPTREKIALGTAKGLAYLHEECKPRCIHRDVKLSNILLTNDFEAKLADFGLARRTDPHDTHVTTAIAGTWGYLSPEYMATGKLTEKSDVYSFGVVLLCLVAGRRPTQPNGPEDQIHLPEWAWSSAERNELEQLIDPRLEGERQEYAANMERMTKIALLCVHTAASVRPSMRQCADMLMGRMEVPRLPKRPPTLYTISSLASSDPDSSKVLSSGQQSSSLSTGAAGAFSTSSSYDAKSIP